MNDEGRFDFWLLPATKELNEPLRGKRLEAFKTILLVLQILKESDTVAGDAGLNVGTFSSFAMSNDCLFVVRVGFPVERNVESREKLSQSLLTLNQPEPEPEYF